PGTLDLRLTEEGGRVETWRVDTRDLAELDRGHDPQGRPMVRRALPLPHLPPLGYHRLDIGPAAGLDGTEATLIVVPDRCWQPDFLLEGRRTWGVSVQLYALRSRANWGHGDFSDLANLVDGVADLGGGFVGINPLHALFHERPDRPSPYSPNSRMFLAPHYIDVAAMPDMLDLKAAGRPLDAGDQFHAREQARHAHQVDYAAVAAAKQAAFDALYRDFRDNHLALDTDRARDFRRFVEAGGTGLRTFAVFEALRDAHAFSGPGGSWQPWWFWPEGHRHPDSPDVAEFADLNGGRIDFHLYLQWEADRQLRAAGERARERLPLGLYRDVAVGFDRDGAEHWAHQDLAPQGVSVGCPLDLRNPIGQVWGVLPYAPVPLHDAAYGPFISLIRSNMRHAGVLRIDHAFQLLRLYWIPLGNRPTEGGYIQYPLEDLLGIIALESHRNRCAVVAEDLGTIPPGFRERIIELGALSFRVLHREREADRSYKAPDTYPAVSTVATGTHDQATLSGFWTGRDVELRRLLNLYPTPEAEREAPVTRAQDREALIAALRRHAGFEGAAEDADGLPSDALIQAVHRFLARTPSRMMIVQPEDLTGETEQVNMPSTVDQHPNWKRRYSFDVEDLATLPRMVALARLLAEEGRGRG
ncbi:MAG: 4-alpha-glucanotransferase, partial [Rhodobacterales bacterium]|nr:4-alpha-glucanotransferase [Rhodobacterales bacterium]